MKVSRIAVCLGLTALISTLCYSQVKRIYGFKGGVNTRAEKGLTREQVGFHEPEGKFFSQSWTFVYYLDDSSGGYLQLSQLRVAYMLDRLSGQHSYYDSRSGRLKFGTALISGGDYSQELDPFSLKMGGQRISGFYPEFRVESEVEGIKADLRFRCRVPGWRPGEGPTHYESPDGDWYDLFVVIPWAEVSGTITSEGETREVHGWGYMDHNVQTVFFTAQAVQIYALRSFSENYAIHMLEYLAPEGYEPRRLAWMLVMKDDRIIYATDKYTIEPAEFVSDGKADYPYPTAVKINVDLPDCRIAGTLRCGAFMEFLDVMDQLPGFVKNLADRFFKQPAFTRQQADVEWHIELNDINENFKAEGIFEVAYVN